MFDGNYVDEIVEEMLFEFQLWILSDVQFQTNFGWNNPFAKSGLPSSMYSGKTWILFHPAVAGWVLFYFSFSFLLNTVKWSG